jgi:hypothetical protein
MLAGEISIGLELKEEVADEIAIVSLISFAVSSKLFACEV